MDELRDYRFYADDMIHTSEKTTSYIWEKFQQVLVGEASANIIKELESFLKMQEHRPMNTDSESHKKLQHRLRERAGYLKTKYPELDLRNFLK